MMTSVGCRKPAPTTSSRSPAATLPSSTALPAGAPADAELPAGPSSALTVASRLLFYAEVASGGASVSRAVTAACSISREPHAGSPRAAAQYAGRAPRCPGACRRRRAFDGGFILSFGATLGILLGAPRSVDTQRLRPLSPTRFSRPARLRRTRRTRQRRQSDRRRPFRGHPLRRDRARAAQRGAFLAHHVRRPAAQLPGHPADDDRAGGGHVHARDGLTARRPRGPLRICRAPRPRWASFVPPNWSISRHGSRAMSRPPPWWLVCVVTTRAASAAVPADTPGSARLGVGVRRALMLRRPASSRSPPFAAAARADAACRVPRRGARRFNAGAAARWTQSARRCRRACRDPLSISASASLRPRCERLASGTIDTVVLTHGDPDHIGGARPCCGALVPRVIWEGVPVPPHPACATSPRRPRRWRVVATCCGGRSRGAGGVDIRSCIRRLPNGNVSACATKTRVVLDSASATCRSSCPATSAARQRAAMTPGARHRGASRL